MNFTGFKFAEKNIAGLKFCGFYYNHGIQINLYGVLKTLILHQRCLKKSEEKLGEKLRKMISKNFKHEKFMGSTIIL